MRGLVESFFTAAEIRSAEFHKANLGGYKPEEVRSYLEELASQMESLQRENETLRGKIELLAKSVEKYRSDEDSIRDAFISAQKVGDATIREARHKAEIIVKTAQEKADALINGTRLEAMSERQLNQRLRQENQQFHERILSAYREQLRLIEELQLAEPPMQEEESTLPSAFSVIKEESVSAVEVEEEQLQPITTPLILNTEEPDDIGDQFIGLTQMSSGSDGEEDVFGTFKRKSGAKARKA